MSEPWFEVPLVTEWHIITEGGDTKVSAANIDSVRVNLRDMPSIVNTPPDVLNSMNQYDVYIAEREREQMEEAEAQAKR